MIQRLILIPLLTLLIGARTGSPVPPRPFLPALVPIVQNIYQIRPVAQFDHVFEGGFFPVTDGVYWSNSTAHVSFSSDGALLAISDGHEVSVWEVQSGDRVNTYTIPETADDRSIYDLMFVDDQHVAIHADQLRIWDVHTGETVETTVADAPEDSSDAIAPYGRSPGSRRYETALMLTARLPGLGEDLVSLVAGAGWNDVVEIRDSVTGRYLFPVNTHPSAVFSMAAWDDSNWVTQILASGGCGETIVQPGDLHPDCDGSSLRLWDFTPLGTWASAAPETHWDTPIMDMDFNAEGTLLATITAGGDVQLWGLPADVCQTVICGDPRG